MCYVLDDVFVMGYGVMVDGGRMRRTLYVSMNYVSFIFHRHGYILIS